MRKRKLWSVKNELAVKSREAMLSAVQVYNNPIIQFKAETFIVLAIISWTYLLHSFYKSKGVDYCYFKENAKGRKKYDKTKYGAKKHWELERCLNDRACPLDISVKENLKFLIGLRHEIEHQMTTKIDYALSAKFQACCINYDNAVCLLLGDQFSISKYLSFSLQFSSLSDPQVEQLNDIVGLPSNITTYISTFDNAINDETYNDPKYSYRVFFVPKIVNRKGQADKVIEFIPHNSTEAAGQNKKYVVIKEGEKKKYLPKAIIKLLNDKGFSKLNQYQFTQCWKNLNAKQDNTYGVLVGGKEWYWYENYIPIVEKYCEENKL